MNEDLRQLARDVEKHGAKTITIKRLLQCYGWENRSAGHDSIIRSDLSALELTTKPNFSSRRLPLGRKIRLRSLFPKRRRPDIDVAD